MKKVLQIIILLCFTISNIFAQVTIKGKVTNSDGEAIPGANVMLKGTTIGTVTGFDGNYSIGNIKPEDILVYSFIGMLEEEILVNNKTEINVTLLDDFQSLDEVVVVGYGSVKRANLAGAVTAINADELQNIPVVNLSAALEGRLSGVRVSVPSGKPGAATKFQIRESSSKKVGEEPLFVIDGIIRDKDAFDLLDPSEVESISILKDASAAVYGASGAGGVVLVETKKGGKGKIKINYTGSYGITQAINTTEMLSAYEHAKMLNDGYDIENRRKSEAEYYTDDELQFFKDSLLNGGHDWLKQAWKNAMVTRHSLNVRGGDEKTSYFVGGNYIHETGNIQDLFIKKYSLRSNIQTEVANGLTASLELSVTNKQNQTPINPHDNNGDVMEKTFKALLQNPKFIPPIIDGYPVKQHDLIDNNPYAIWENNNYSKGWLNSYTATASLSYDFPFINGLNARIQYSQSKSNEYGKRYETTPIGYEFESEGGHNHIIRYNAPIIIDTITGLPYERPYSGEESLQESNDRSSSYQTNLSLSYNRTLGKNEISALVICEFSEDESNRVGWNRSGMQTIDNYDLEWAFPINDRMLTPNRSENGSIGYVGRLNYTYASKYIAEFAGRYESSTKFSEENRWGFFPSFLFGWVVSEEGFFERIEPVINFLKFRGSAGILGNDNFPSFQYLLRYKPRTEFVLFGDQPVNTLNAENGGVVNDKLKWQTTYSYNGGVDMRLFNSLIDISLDAFYELTDNMLDPIGSIVPPTSGIASNSKVYFNYGKAHSYGYEVELGIHKNLPYNFQAGVSGNFSWAEERLLRVAQSITAEGTWHDELKNHQDNQTGAISSGLIRTEEEIEDILMDNPNYTNNGYFNNNETGGVLELGMLNHKDIRGTDGSEGPNGRFSYALEEDRTIIAEHSSPTYTYGTSFNLSWKDIRLNMTFSGKFGHMAIYDKEALKLPTEKANVPAFWRDYWTPENPDAAYPMPAADAMEAQYSTFWLRNGHTLRLTDLNLSYALPANWSNKMGISSFKIFFNTKYLWTIISPFDYKDANLSNYNGYPMTRTYNFGMNLSL